MTDDHAWFIDEPFCTDLLLRQEVFPGTTLDPCCGMGQTLMAMERDGYSPARLFGADLVDRCSDRRDAWSGRVTVRDFLTWHPEDDHRPDNIIMNPPFGGGLLVEQFIERARAVARCRVAALVRADFLGSQRRVTWWHANKPQRLYMLAPRPSMPPGEEWIGGAIAAAGGYNEYIWCVWDRTAEPSRAWPSFWWLTDPTAMPRRLGRRDPELVAAEHTRLA